MNFNFYIDTNAIFKYYFLMSLMQLQKKQYHFIASLGIYLATALSFAWGFLPILQQGYHETALFALKNWSNNNSLNLTYLPENGSWASVFVDFAVLAISVQSNLTFWTFLLFNLVFTLFIRSNLESFKSYLENVEVACLGEAQV